MSEWKKHKISALIESKVLVIGDGYRAKNSELSPDEGLPFARAGTINDGFQFEGAEYLAPENLHKPGEKISQPGDVLFTSKGTVGRIAFVTKTTPKFVYSPQLTWWRVLDTQRIDPEFLYCWMRGREFISQINSFSGQTDMAAYVSLKDQRQMMHITLPEIEEQKEIAASISCLDRKIENLRRQNETLEAIAQSLFKHWFVDFEFPNADGKPYKSSGGTMKPSELGEIPAGWRVGKLNDVLSLIIDYRGKTPKKLGSDWSLSGIPALSAKNIKDGQIVREDAINFVDEDLYRKWMKDELQKGDVLLTSEAPLGEIFYLANNEKYVLSQRLYSLRTKNNFGSTYLYFWLKSIQGQFLLERRATGSTVQGIRQVELRKVEIIIPLSEILDKSTNLWLANLEKIESNAQQIRILNKTRDLLLPKLISGQLRISEK